MSDTAEVDRDQIMGEIGRLPLADLRVMDVRVEDADDAQGPVALVKVLLGSKRDSGWDADDFATLRYSARNVVERVMGGRDFRLVYEEYSGPDPVPDIAPAADALEELEMAQDVAAYREAKAADDGGRVTLDELRRSR